MGKKVTKLTLKPQVDTTAFLATWEFGTTNTTTTKTSSAVKVGSLVSIKSDAVYYNGVAMPDFVKTRKWYITEVDASKNRAVLGKSSDGAYKNINSPVHTKYLTVNGSSGETSGSTSSSTLEHYKIEWRYYTGDGIWFVAETTETKYKYATYTPPENALKVKIRVKPVSKKKKSNGKEVSYWTGDWVNSEVFKVENTPPEVPSTPDVTIEKYKLTASLENISDPKTDKIEFQIQNGNTLINKNATPVDVKNTRVSYTHDIVAGGEYRVRCRAVNVISGGQSKSDWSAWSTMDYPIPATPKKIKTCRASSKTSIYLEWDTVKTAKTYDIQYANKKTYFDITSQTTTESGIEQPKYEFIGLETGKEYFFRVRSVNEKGESGWSPIVSTIIGTKPTAPTTWSSSTTVIVGEPLTLYWTHNSEDNSKETYAQIEYTIDGKSYTEEVKNTKTEDDTNTISFKSLNTTAYQEGVKIKWRVRTAGVTNTLGEWSVQREVTIYAPPVLTLRMLDSSNNDITTLTSFPFKVKGSAGPETQTPTGYHISIKSNDVYTQLDQVGNRELITKNQEIYSKYFDISTTLETTITASDVDFQNGMSYTLTCTASMNSGLTATASKTFTVSWSEVIPEPDVEISVDNNNYTATIRPYCVDEDNNLVDNISLAIYRREFDGSFVEVASGLRNNLHIAVTDPHPALDYARYRITATSDLTGAVSFYDPPGEPVNGVGAVIQWDETCTDYNNDDEEEPEISSWMGTMLVLPYNVDISDDHDPEVSLIKYIGRKHPVGYYGTQVGKTANWSVVVPKDDAETLFNIRRLAGWMGDVYVRESSGSGYWANATVSFSQTHNELTIPVTFKITRVDKKEA